MKKFLSLTFVAAAALSLTACDQGHPPPKSNFGPKPTLPAPASGTSAYSSTLQITDTPVAVSGSPLTQASAPRSCRPWAAPCTVG